MGTIYISAETAYSLAMPPALLFSTSADVPTPLMPGVFTDCTRIAGSGTAPPPFLEGNPFGTFAGRIQCTVAGYPNVLGEVNPGALPWFRLSCDAGVTYGRSRELGPEDSRGRIDWLAGPISATTDGAIGVSMLGRPGLYAADDVFSFTTRPSPDLVALIPRVCAFVDTYLVGSWGDTLPLTAWAPDLEQVVADLLRWRMVCKAGLASREDMKVYSPEMTGVREWLKRAQSGEFANAPGYVPSIKRGTGTPNTSFPLMVPGVDPLAGMLI